MYIQKEVKRGYNAYMTMGLTDCNTNMDVGLLVLEPGDVYSFDEPEKELNFFEKLVKFFTELFAKVINIFKKAVN